MIELESLGKTTASLARLQAAMQRDVKNFRRGESARAILNNLRIAAQVGAAKATVANQDGEAVGFVTVRFDPEHHLGNIRLLYVAPGAETGAGALLANHAIDTVWADPSIQYLNASLFVDQPGIRQAFESRSAQCIERQEMRIGDLSGYPKAVDLPDGFRLAPWSADAVEPAARLTIDSYQGTVDDLLFADMQTVEGMTHFIRETMSNTDGVFDTDASVLAYDKDTLAGLALCSIRDEKLGFVFEINVGHDYRRRGLARAMLINALNAFARKGATAAQLWVTLSNPARALYEELGFRQHLPIWVYVASRV